MDTTPQPAAEGLATGGLSPPATRVADWLRDMARTAKSSRLYHTSNSLLVEARDAFAHATNQLLDDLGTITVQVSPEELQFEEERLVHPTKRGPGRGEAAQRLLTELPHVLYRDGVRSLSIRPGVPRHDVDALVDALAVSWAEQLHADDLVTALWQANPTHIHVESAPPEQTLYVATANGEPDASDRGFGLGFGLPPTAGEVHGDLGDRGGAVGLQRESGLEETPVAVYISPRRGYQALAADANDARLRLLQAWEAEKLEDWREGAVALFERLRTIEPSPETDATLLRFAVSGVAHAIVCGRWSEAIELLARARRMGDVDDALRASIASKREGELGEALDEATPQDLDAFFRLTIELGEAGVPLALGALEGAKRMKTRAAASAALTFLCADDPARLEGALCSRSAETTCHIVAILGHIGGRSIAPLCIQAAHHPDSAVTREVARIVPAIAEPERDDVLSVLLDSRDTATLLLALRSASRGRNPRVARMIVRMIEAPRFDERPEEERRTLFQALSDTGDAGVIPFLEAQLNHGGWFARPTWKRTAAAHALERLVLPEAAAALARGRASANEAVRAACREVGRTEAA